MPKPQTLTDLFRDHADFVRNSGFTVTVSQSLPSVTMTGPDGESIYLDGHEAEAFIDRAKSLWRELGDIEVDVVFLAAAKPYIEAA